MVIHYYIILYQNTLCDLISPGMCYQNYSCHDILSEDANNYFRHLIHVGEVADGNILQSARSRNNSNTVLY